jgi:hypothetical protein
MLDRHKRHWHLEGCKLYEVVAWKHTVGHSWSWGKQESKKKNNKLSLATLKALLQVVVCI